MLEKDSKEYPELGNKNKHSYYKDSPTRDFDVKEKKWKSSTYKNNKRIKKAIKECKNYIKGVMK